MWRIRIDTACRKLALEVRDPDLLLTHFYTLDAAGFILQKLDINPSKAWWQGLEDAQYGMVYLHGYGDRKTGQHKGITALSADTGNQEWSLDDMAFYGLSQEGMLVYNPNAPEEALTIIGPENGDTIQTDISQYRAAQQVSDFSSDRYRDCVYPVLYMQGESYFEDVCNFLIEQSGARPVQGIAYAEANSCIVISYYAQAESGELDNFVVIYDLEGKLRLKVKLGSGLSGIGSDTFFIFNLGLYLLLDKQILQVYSLLA
ncbi:hypothetical protein ABID22_000924 [Pontibacter aydingkolensis]|uniref:DUF4905 domain-containing protein n=1 Tax=Pontibacter aydingkolensis TaxID=1911536 RepID=A0ABS7CSJ1_9BACT|nr:DUF4905 domain-containing protein [Pontibacter aydingkolensis]MBW7466822.1 DUF4905 domain-containing protein [Pontibacter aydingkolensis]